MRTHARITGKRIGSWIVFAALAAMVVAPAGAYEQYSIDDDATNCRFCHGDFRAGSYTSLSDGQNWGNLHDLHRFDMLSGDCDTCHQPSAFPVFINDSDGGQGLPSIGCVGCHGRAEDATQPTGTEGYGIALQRRHEAASAGGDQNGLTCFSCHPEAATATPVGEEVLPPYYANPGVGHPDIPDDPCNPLGTENFAGSPAGLDNDGDLVADQGDTDCAAAVVSPGEASGAALPPLLVTGRSATTISISYGVPCEATDHRIHFGPLAQVSSYLYTGTQCAIGSTGAFTWNLPPSDSTFYLVVGNDADVEGSYGTDSTGTERPSSLVGSACTVPQDLANRCDP